MASEFQNCYPPVPSRFPFFTSTTWIPSLTSYEFQGKRFWDFTLKYYIFQEVYQLSTGLEIATNMIAYIQD